MTEATHGYTFRLFSDVKDRDGDVVYGRDGKPVQELHADRTYPGQELLKMTSFELHGTITDA
jgi:hypothetical protein